MHVEAQVREASRPLWPLACAALSLAVLATIAIAAPVSPERFVFTAFAVAALSFLAFTRTSSERRSKLRAVDVDARGLTVDGQLVMPRPSILGAHVATEPDGTFAIVVEGRGLFRPRRIVRVASEATAKAIASTLDRAGADVAEFDALPPWAHRMRWLAVALTTSPWILFNVLRHLPASAILFVVPLYGLIAIPMVLPQKVTIGEDGILLRWAGSRRFIAYGAMKEARATSLGIELDLGNDSVVEVRLTHRSDGATTRRSAILSRIEDGIAADRKRGSAEDATLLARGDRSLEEWLTGVAQGGVGYRVNAIPRDRLWEILENASANASVRQGAALALRAELDEEERERMAAVAEKSASPRLRIALGAVARADDVHLRVALAEAEEAEEDVAPSRAAKTANRD